MSYKRYIQVFGGEFYIPDGYKKVRDHFKLSLMGNFELWVKLARKEIQRGRESEREKKQILYMNSARSLKEKTIFSKYIVFLLF